MEENLSPSRINWETWIREIRDIGKTNGLTNFAPNPFGQIDLDRAHPSGIAQFTASGTVLLSNLVREPLAFSKALVTSRRIKAKSLAQLKDFGIRTTYLIGGIVSLEKDGFDLNLPLLLWPIDLLRKTDDFELSRTGSAFINPALTSSLFDTYGIYIDSTKLMSLLETASDLLPITVIDYISSLFDENANVELRRALVIGNFAVEPALLEADIKPEGSRLLRQLAEVSEVSEPIAELNVDPRLVADADVTQKRIVARAVAGESFAVETLPGTGYTQTVVNVLSALVHDGKKVLVVTPRQQTINELAERFAALNLNGLLVRSSIVWLDVVGAISRYEKAQSVDLIEAGVKRESAASHLQSYLQGLTKQNAHLGHSLLDIFEALAKLSAMPNPPTSAARLDSTELQKHKDRATALSLLESAEAAGLFLHGPADSAWFGANFATDSQVAEITELAKQLHETDFKALDSKLQGLVISSNFRGPKNLREFGEYLNLWAGVAASLDRFVPEVFDRDVSELIDATGPRKLGNKISGSTRRKLKKLAKEYLRAGMSVNDLNQALKDIKAQRDLWADFSLVGAAPQIVPGFSDTNVAYRNFITDVSRVFAHVREELGRNMMEDSISEVVATLASLATELAPLENLEERNRIRKELEQAGLTDVYQDFARLHVDREHLAAQFDLVWWQSAFEELLLLEPEIASYSAEKISVLEEEFVTSDQEHNNLGVGAFNELQSHHWKETLQARPEESERLKSLLRSRAASFLTLNSAAANLSSILLSAYATSPLEIANTLPDGLTFDAVLVLDAAGSNIGENIAALQRAGQVVAFGDSAIAAPVGFELEANETPIELDVSSTSVFDQVARIFGVESMRKSWRPTGLTLGALINREFYQNRIVFEPTASEYAGKSNFELHQVKAKAATEDDLLNESPETEVNETVQVVMRHARLHPEDSLMVVTASAVHAERIQGQLDAKVLEHADLKQFFDTHGDEKFEVTTLNKLTHRVADRIIFAPGFGALANGKASNSLGQLSLESGRRTFANLLVSARKSLSVVTSITADTLPEEPIGAAKQFAKIFKFGSISSPTDEANDVDPMLNDLALRLRKLGAHVTLGYTPRISMAVSYGATSAVIVPDWDLVGDDLSEQVRLRPALLNAMGWIVIRVHALEVFADPQTLAIRIGDQLGMRLSEKAQSLFDEPSFSDTDAGWGEMSQSNDQRLLGDKPPHWG